MKALVTGGGGFLGRYIVEALLARGDEVRSFSRRRSSQLDALGVEQCQGDLRDQNATIAACDGVDVVFHNAAIAGLAGPWSLYHGINTIGTQNIVAGCRKHNVAKLVYTSSPSVTFDGREQCGIDESAPYPTKWLAHYPHSKALAEQHVLAANGRDGLATCASASAFDLGPARSSTSFRV